MAHPFTGYNKSRNQGVLVGNWVEEQALNSSTGTHRYKAWVDDSQPGQEKSVYPKHLKEPKVETFGRVFSHDDKLVSLTSNSIFVPYFQKMENWMDLLTPMLLTTGTWELDNP